MPPQITTITYERLWSLGNYENERLSATVSVEDDNYELAFNVARDAVEEQHARFQVERERQREEAERRQREEWRAEQERRRQGAVAEREQWLRQQTASGLAAQAAEIDEAEIDEDDPVF